MDQNTQQGAKKGGSTMLIAGIVGLLVLGAAAWYLMSQSNNTQQESTATTQQPAQEQQQTQPTQVEESTGEASPAADAKGEVKEFTVDGKNFSISPAQMRVNEGDTVRIVFNNTQGFHDWGLDEFDAKTAQIQAGKSETIEFVADKKGSYEYYCSVGNHKEMGMKGILTVE